MGYSLLLFLYFRLFNTVDSKQINVRYNNLSMTGFELVASEVTALPTEPQPLPHLFLLFQLRRQPRLPSPKV